MGLLKMLAAPLRSAARFPLVQLALVVAVILLLQAADEHSTAGRIFNALDKLVDHSVASLSAAFSIRSFTRSWLTTSLWIGYVYLAGIVLLWLLRGGGGLAADVAGRWNLLWLRNTIARERGIAAYRAWEPFERIRPRHVSQQAWEDAFAWPADGRPPYPPLVQRMARGVLGYAIVILAVAALLQYLTPLPALDWLGRLARSLFGAL